MEEITLDEVNADDSRSDETITLDEVNASPSEERISWEVGDGKPSVLQDGETNEWGGNLRNEGRKVLFRRDANGKIAHYSTTSSTRVKDDDGRFAVIPTVVDGVELSQEDAERHYKKTGEHWGKTNDEDSAKKLQEAVHARHMKDNQRQWNNYIHSHWDEMSDDIRNDPGVAEEHRRLSEEQPMALPKSVGGTALPDAQRLGSDSTVNAVSETALAPELREVSPEKVKRSKADIMRLRWQAETGQRDNGAFQYAFSGVVPFFGGINRNEEADKIQRMKDFADGNPRLETKSVPEAPVGSSITGYAQYSSRPLSEDEQWAYEASYLGVPKNEAKIKDGESQEVYRKRLSSLVGSRFKDAVLAQKEARQELEKTDMGWTDTMVVDGLQSIGYGLEFLPFGSMAAQPAKLGFSLLSRAGLKKLLTSEGRKLVVETAAKRLGRDAAIAAGPTVTGAANKYRELTRTDYDIDKNGNVVVASQGDEKGVGTALKAIGSTYLENIMENVVGDLIARPVATKIFDLVGRTGKIGLGVKRIYQAYNRAAENTGFGDIFIEEPTEEDLQFFETDVLGWGKKNSEYEGFWNELNQAFGRRPKTDAFGNKIKGEDGNYEYENGVLSGIMGGDGQYTIKGRINTMLAMVMQMGLQASVAGGVRGIRYVDAAHNSAEYSERTGLTKETVDKFSKEQKIAFARLHNFVAEYFKGDPKRLQEALDRCGKFVGMKTEEMAKQATYKLENDIRAYGVEPKRFRINTEPDENGVPRPKFERRPYRNPLTGEEAEVDAMVNEETDPETGEVRSSVSVIDHGDGTYSVEDSTRPGHSYEADELWEAIGIANLYTARNQKRNLDNDRKKEYARQLLKTKYKRNTLVFDGVSDVLRFFENGMRQNGGSFLGVSDPWDPKNGLFVMNGSGEVELRGGKTSGGLTLPDGSIAVVLDNIASPADMNRVLSHEPGHASAKKDEAARLEFLKRADPNSEYGQILEDLKKRNAATGNKWSEDYIVGEAFSKWLERRGHNPTLMQRIHAKTLGKFGKVGDAELEVLANQIERETESGAAGAEDFDNRVQFIGGGYGLGEAAPSEEEYLGGKPAEKPVITADLSEATAAPENAAPESPSTSETGDDYGDDLPPPDIEDEPDGAPQPLVNAPEESKTGVNTSQGETKSAENDETATEKPVETTKSETPPESDENAPTSASGAEGTTTPAKPAKPAEAQDGASDEGSTDVRPAPTAQTDDDTYPTVVDKKSGKRRLTGIAAQRKAASDAEKAMRKKFAEEDPRGQGAFAEWNRRGRLFNEPPHRTVRNANGRGTHKEYYGDPAAEAINHLLDGKTGAERERLENLLFGKKGKRVSTSLGGNDTDYQGNDYERVVEDFMKAYGRYEEFAANGGRTLEEQKLEADEAEARAREVKIGGDSYDIEDIEAHSKADEVYNEAVAEVDAVEGDSPFVKNFSREQLNQLKKGDTIRFDHSEADYEVESYDAKNNEIVVSVGDVKDNPLFTEAEKAEMTGRRFRLTENGWIELNGRKTEDGNERKNAEGTDENLPRDAQGERGGGFGLESATQAELNAESARRRQREELKRRQNAPLKGGAGETGQTLMDLGGAEGGDLFNRTERTEAQAAATAEEKPAASPEDAAYRDWLAKYRLKDTPAHRKEFDEKHKAKPVAAPSGAPASMPEKPAAPAMSAAEARKLLKEKFFQDETALNRDLARLPPGANQLKAAYAVALDEARKRAAKSVAQGGVTPELRERLSKTEIGRSILGNYDANAKDDPKFALEQLNRSIEANRGEIDAVTESDEVRERPKETKRTGKPEQEEITDVGEKIAGARKDLIRDYVAALNDATKEQLAELPFSKAFKKPDLAKAVESGALREQDALFYDAVLALVNPRKPRIKKNDEWRKKYNPGFRSDLDKWVDNTYNALQTLKGFLELDEAGRDKLIEKSLSQEYLDVDADKRRMEELQRINNRELKFGESYTPNPVHVTAEMLRRLGYKAGDKVEIPFPTIRTSTVFDSYTPQSHEGNGIYLDSAKTLDEVIDAMVYLTKLNRGDTDLRHPDRAFSIKHTRNIVGETGKFIVMWGGKYGMNNQRKFDTKKEADEFAKSKNSIATPERAVTGRTDYVIRFRNLVSGAELHLDEQKFATREEAQKYLDENRDVLNDAANEAIAKEAGRKVEKRKTAPDDLVKIGMFHGSKGLSWGVYVDNPASESGRELLRDGFRGREEAKRYRDEIKDAYFARWNESNEKRKAFVFFDVGDEKRIGEDWRGGKDMKAEDFMNTFGFRGVQFGNWTNQDDRQMAVNQAFDAFKDLARLIGVPDKAISLNGELGIAFGARGSGNALAHYEPDEIVINLTKTRGAGSLAHEWWHALDNYFARAAGVKRGMVTDSQTIKMRDELREAFNRLVREVEFSSYYRRSKKQGAYWGRMHEVTARLLAEWVDRELKRSGELNTFLSRGAKNAEVFAEMNYELYRGEMEAAKKEPLSFDEFKKTENAYQGFPYPTAEEVEKFGGLLRGIFDTVETDADTGILWDTDLLKIEQPNTHDIVADGKTVFTGRFRTDAQADGYARHFYGDGAKAVRRNGIMAVDGEPRNWPRKTAGGTGDDVSGSNIGATQDRGVEDDGVLFSPTAGRDPRGKNSVVPENGAVVIRGSDGSPVYGFGVGKNVPQSQIVDLFGYLNSDERNARLARAVFDVAEKLGVKFSFGDTTDADGNIHAGATKGRSVMLDSEEFGSSEVPDEIKAETILHEAIHAVTSYAIDMVNGNGGAVNGARMNDSLVAAVRELNGIYDSCKDRYGDEYGFSNEHEFLAELSNPQFRGVLKKMSVFDRIVGVIRKIIAAIRGIRNMEDVAFFNLRRFLDNYDKAAFDAFHDAAAGERSARAVRRETVDFDTKLLAPENDRGGFDDDEIRNAANEAGRKYVRLGAEIAGGTGGAQRERLGGKTARLSAREVLAAARSDERYFGGLEKAREDIPHEPFPDGILEKGGQESPLVMRTGDRVVKFRSASAPDFEFQKVGRHNMFFGDAAKMPHMVETPYELKGFAADKKGREGELFAILEQPFVDMVPNSGKEARYLLLQDLRNRFGEVKKLGEREIEVDGWVIDDLKDANIAMVKGAKKYAVVDCFIHRKHELPRYADETGGGVDFDTDLTPAEEDGSPKIDVRNWHDVTVSRGSSANDRRIFDLFNHFNRNEESKRIADKVFPLAEKLNFTLYTESDLGDLAGWQYGDVVAFNADWLSDRSVSPQEKANAILHEFIHHVTTYAIDAVSGKIDTGDLKVSDELREAVEDLAAIYEQTEKALRRKGKTNYAQTFELNKDNPDAQGDYFAVQEATKYARLKEFLAELSNPAVRNELKKMSLWERTVNGIRRVLKSVIDLFGEGGLYGVEEGDVQNNALDVALANLDKFLDNLDYRLGGEKYYDMLQEREKERKTDRTRKTAMSSGGVNYGRGGEVQFDTDLTPEENERLIGFTNDEVRARLKEEGIELGKHVSVPDERTNEKAESLASNLDYMRKFAQNVISRTEGGVSPAENKALMIYLDTVQEHLNAVNAALGEISPEDAKGDRKGEYVELKKRHVALTDELTLAGMAKVKAASVAGGALRSQRDRMRHDRSFAGIVSEISQAAGVADGEKIPQWIIEEAQNVAKEFENKDVAEYEYFANRWREFSKAAFASERRAKKIRDAAKSTRNSDDAKTVARNYEKALTRLEVYAKEGNATVEGIEPKFLKSLSEFHIMADPSLVADPETAEEKVMDAVTKDVQTFFPLVGIDTVRRIITDYGHNHKMSKRETQAIMNELKRQSLKKVQLDVMRTENRLPDVTGGIDVPPSDERLVDVTRALTKEANEEKKLVPEGSERALKSYVETALKSLDNRIRDLRRAIEIGEKIPRKERRVVDDVRIIQKRKELEEVRKTYDELFKTSRTMTPEQRIAAAERATLKVMEGLAKEIADAENGVFAQKGRATPVESDLLKDRRKQIEEMRKRLKEMKKAAYMYGRTPAEIMAHNRRIIQNLENRLMEKATWLETGKIPTKPEKLPMTKKQKEEYEALRRQNRLANRKLEELRQRALTSRMTAPKRIISEYWKWFIGMLGSSVGSFDISGGGRQGVRAASASPKLAARASRIAWNAMRNEDYFNEVNEAIASDPVIKEAVEKYGLFLRSADIDFVHDVEMFKGRNTPPPPGLRRLIERLDSIPVIGRAGKAVREKYVGMMEASERNYVTVLNVLCAETYKRMLADIDSPSGFQKRKLAGLANLATGSGILTKEMRSAINSFSDKVKQPIWSPPLMVSQIENKIGLDLWTAPFGEGDEGEGKPTWKQIGQVEKEAVKLRVRSELALLALGALLAYMWAPDDWLEEWKDDVRNGKLWNAFWTKLHHPVVGKGTHIDLEMGGLSAGKQISAFLADEYETSTGRVVKPGDFGFKDYGERIGRYLQGKLHPAWSIPINLWQNRDYLGNPFGIKELMTSAFPLSMRDTVELAVNEEWKNGAAVVGIVSSLIGTGGNYYDESENYYKRAVNRYMAGEIGKGELAAARALNREVMRLKKMEEESPDNAASVKAERERLQDEIKKAIRGGSGLTKLNYIAARASFEAEEEAYREVENDETLTDEERGRRLSELEAANPLLKEENRTALLSHGKKKNSGLIPDADRAKRRLDELSGSPESTEEERAEASKDYDEARKEVLKFICEHR